MTAVCKASIANAEHETEIDMAKARFLILDFMSRNVVKLRPKMEILHAVHNLIDGRMSGAPVVDDDDAVVGMLTERDCMKVVLNAAYHQEHGGFVEEFMGTDIEVMHPEMSIVDAAKEFYEKRYLRYPVVDDGRLVGVISRSDVMRAIGEYWNI
jgi:CBS domain-containing protein